MRPLFACALLLSSTARADTTTWTWRGTDGSVIHGAEPLPNGDVLVSEKDMGRVIEVAPTFPEGGTIVWAMNGLSSPDRTRRLGNGHTLIADTGANRVIEVDADGGVVWSYGDGTLRCVATSTDLPGDAERLPNGNTVVPGEWYNRIVEVTPAGALVWWYGRSDCNPGSALNETASPFSVFHMASGELLVAEINNDRVVAISRSAGGGNVTWAYGSPSSPGSGPNRLYSPFRAVELANGNVLIADGLNHRVIEVKPTRPAGGALIWQYGTTGINGADAGQLDLPYDAQRVPTGATLIAERENHRAQLVVPDTAPARLQFVTPSLTLNAGECSSAVTVRVASTGALAVTVPRDTRVTLATSVPSTRLYSDASCNSLTTEVSMPADSSDARFYVVASEPGFTTITARAPWLIPAAQTEAVVAQRVVFVACGCGDGAGPALGLLMLALLPRKRSTRYALQ